jgi:uncharacterized protein YjbI with pentapeptide repeats
MGRGTEKSPYTREVVLRLIKKNDDTAVGLNLSGKVFEEGIDLSWLNLDGIILNKAVLREAHLEGAALSFASLEQAYLFWAHLEMADLSFASLERAVLSEAHLEGTFAGDANFERASLRAAILENSSLIASNFENAFIAYANFKRADLSDARLEGANLRGANLQKAILSGVNLSHDTKLESVNWGDYILGEERGRFFDWASGTYRSLKMWHKEHGLYDIAAKFYYREKEARRKGASRWYNRLAGWFSWALFGHGERWERILIWIAGFISLFTLIYFLIGKYSPSAGTLTPGTLTNSLYYSAVSFISLGYGSWVQDATGWVKGLGVFEAFIGFFMMTLFLVTFVRKWAR